MYGLKSCQSVVIIIEIKIKLTIIKTKRIVTNLVKGAEHLYPLIGCQSQMVFRALVHLPGLHGGHIIG